MRYIFPLVFYYMCYEGSVDLENIPDWNERHSKEVQIMEFGQVPKQIFLQPHPKRNLPTISKLLSAPPGINFITFFLHFFSSLFYSKL